MIVTVGRQAVVDLLQDHTSITEWQYLAVGTDGTAEGAGDSALGAEVERVLGTQGEGDPHVYKLTVTWQNTTGDAVVVAEIGVFNAAVAGTMLAREVLDTPVNVPNDGNLTITWTCSVTAVE